jgi:hypothetical protein
MFNFRDYAHFETDLPHRDVVRRICDALDPIGDAEPVEDDEIEVAARRYGTWAYETSVAALLRQHKNGREYEVTIEYKIEPQVVIMVLCVLFFMPLGLIVLLLGMNTKQELDKLVRRAVRDIEKAF